MSTDKIKILSNESNVVTISDNGFKEFMKRKNIDEKAAILHCKLQENTPSRRSLFNTENQIRIKYIIYTEKVSFPLRSIGYVVNRTIDNTLTINKKTGRITASDYKKPYTLQNCFVMAMNYRIPLLEFFTKIHPNLEYIANSYLYHNNNTMKLDDIINKKLFGIGDLLKYYYPSIPKKSLMEIYHYFKKRTSKSTDSSNQAFKYLFNQSYYIESPFATGGYSSENLGFPHYLNTLESFLCNAKNPQVFFDKYFKLNYEKHPMLYFLKQKMKEMKAAEAVKDPNKKYSIDEDLFRTQIKDYFDMGRATETKFDVGWSVKRFMKEHDEIIDFYYDFLANHEPNPMKVDQFFIDNPLLPADVFKMVSNEYELRKEGKYMRHCVGSYADTIRQGNCCIYIVSYKQERYTLEVRKSHDNKTWSLYNSQVRARFNNYAPTEVQEIIEEAIVNANNAIKGAKVSLKDKAKGSPTRIEHNNPFYHHFYQDLQ